MMMMMIMMNGDDGWMDDDGVCVCVYMNQYENTTFFRHTTML
jgi:hypothetical protein